MDRAAAVLAKAWFAAWKGWWLASAGALAGIVVLVLGTAALLEGMEGQAEARVADFFTGDLRVTLEEEGAAPATPFAANTSADLASLQQALAGATGARVEPRVETTFALSRRSLVEAYLFEDDQYGLQLPGTTANRDAYSVGVLIGTPLQEATARDRLRPYLVTGAFPEPAPNGTAEVELLLSTRMFAAMLDLDERERLSDPPSPGQLAALHMEVTAARVDDSGPLKDLIRFPARVVGLYDSGIDAMDGITVVMPIEDARRLMGAEPDDPYANVLTVHGPTAAAKEAAQGNGWAAESPASFTDRYLGQLVDLVRVMGLTLSSLLMVVPFFMVWVGMGQQLDRSRRELAVCRAIGVQPGTVRRAMAMLAARVALLAIVPAAVLLVGLQLALPGALERAAWFPFPLGFQVPAWAVLVTLANVLLAGLVAVAGALRRHGAGAIASTLRAA